MMPEVTATVRAPRALEVPWPLGFPLGEPGDAELQREVLRQLLELTARVDLPLTAEYRDDGLRELNAEDKQA